MAISIFATTIFAQKPPINHSVYDEWKSLTGLKIHNNGDIATYTISEQEGDAELIIRTISNNKTISIPRASRVSISKDSKNAVAVIKPFFKETRAAKIKKLKRDDMPKDTLAIINIASGEVKKYPNYKIHYVPSKFNSTLVFELTPAKDTSKKKSKKVPDKELYVMDVNTLKIDTLNKAAFCKFNEEGTLLAYLNEVDKKDSLSKPGLYLYNIETKETKEIFSAPKGATIKLPTFSKASSFAFYANPDTLKENKKNINIYHYDINSQKLTLAAHNKMEGLQEGWIVNDKARLDFSKDGKRLIFGTSPKPLEKDTTLVEFEQPQLDIWSWDADYNQPMQLLSREADLNKTYTAYIDCSFNSKFVQLGTIDIPTVTIPNDKMGNYTIVRNNKKYRIQTQWDISPKSDVYIMDVNTGEKELLFTNSALTSNTYSPDGKYAISYNNQEKQYFLINLETKEISNLTQNLGVAFHDTKHDTPSLPSPAGFSVWFEDNRYFLIADEYDYWIFDATGKEAPKNYTDNYGRLNNTKLTITKVIENPDEPISRIPLKLKYSEPIYFTTFNNTTKEYGYMIKDITKKSSKLTKLVEGPYRYNGLSYSKPTKGKVGKYMYIKGNFEIGNNLWITADNFKSEQQLSDINPQQRDYNWGTVELVNWQTEDDIFCEGLLYKPEDFNPNKKYPVIIYFYEKNSETLYVPRNPAPSRSTVNIPFFVSNGYVVFVPDIYYKDGHPGQCAMRSIMPGVKMLEEKYPWIDGENMAIQGQSWGGYQVAYMITQTDKFKAAGAGAPVANMTSAYGGIRWGTGMVRQFQYEQTQSRIGKDLWSGFDLYYENSPLFFVPNVKTPVLIMHNDKDGAVPWYQGIEFFTALRRLGKVAWLLQYNNEEHNLEERRNAKDLSIRLEQFFNHYLKGAPMPEWMKYGRPAVKKGFDLGYKLVE